MTVKEINDNYKEINGFDYNNGIIIDKFDKEEVIAHVDATSKAYNPWEIVHGGLIFGLADTAAGILCYANGHKSVTIDANINYLKPLKGYIKAVATKIKTGKTINLYKVDIYNEKEELCATVTFNYFNKE